MKKERIKLQDVVLSRLRESGLEAKIFLLKGFQISGKVVDYDTYVVLVSSMGKQQMIFKHAISTIQLPDSLEINISDRE
ncbi:RNA chaperone Hfq [Candidatus Riflebacteria bacterium]